MPTHGGETDLNGQDLGQIYPDEAEAACHVHVAGGRVSSLERKMIWGGLTFVCATEDSASHAGPGYLLRAAEELPWECHHRPSSLAGRGSRSWGRGLTVLESLTT